MANWISCAPISGQGMLFVNLDNVVSVSGDNSKSLIRDVSGNEFIVADRPEVLMAKRVEKNA